MVANNIEDVLQPKITLNAKTRSDKQRGLKIEFDHDQILPKIYCLLLFVAGALYVTYSLFSQSNSTDLQQSLQIATTLSLLNTTQSMQKQKRTTIIIPRSIPTCPKHLCHSNHCSCYRR